MDTGRVVRQTPIDDRTPDVGGLTMPLWVLALCISACAAAGAIRYRMFPDEKIVAAVTVVLAVVAVAVWSAALL
jgi:hypothetical protein